MQIFRSMEDLFFDSYEQFIEEIDVERKQMLEFDHEMLNIESRDIDLKNAKFLPQGCFHTIFENVRFECFFYYKADKPLYVFLNGAGSYKISQKANFSRWSYYTFLNGSMLNIADPMLALYPDLKLGWYYGSEKINFRKIVADLVLKIAGMYNISSSNIVFVGSSGGGAATIECAGYLKDSKAVAINPQIVLDEYGYAKEFSEITGNNLKKDDKWHRHNVIFHLQKNNETTYILIVNLRSSADMRQLQNICNAKSMRVKYGLNVFDNLIVWIYDGDLGIYKSPHSTQEYYCIWFLIEHLVENAKKVEYLSENESLYRLVGEFWHEHWDAERKWKDRTVNVEKTMFYLNKKRETALWGIGRKADEFAKGWLDISGTNYFNIHFALDNNIEKRESTFHNIPVRHPSDIDNWDEIYVIITSDRYDKEIQTQMEKIGMSYGKDFVSYKDLWN